MGQSSQAGHVVLRSQTTQGTLEPDIATAGISMKLRSGSLGPNRDLLIPDPEIGGGRDVNDAYLGAVSWSGDYEFYARLDGLSTLMRAAFGTAVISTTTGVSTKTLTPSDAAALPFLSIEESIGASLETYNYTDAVVNTLHLEADANGYLMGTAGMVAAKQVAGATRTSVPPEDDLPMIVGTNILITYNGVTVSAKSFSFDLTNNFEDDDFRLGSFYVGALTPKRREVTAGFTIRPDDSALWRQATYGISSATAPGGLTTKQQLIITCTTYESIVGATPSTTKNSLTLTIPKFILNPYALSASGDDIIQTDITGQAVRPVSGTPLMTGVIVTGGTLGAAIA